MSVKEPETKSPQLAMARGLNNLPEIILPEGYTVRGWRPGDDNAWEEIILSSFGGTTDEYGKEKRLHLFSMLKDDNAFRPERVIFVCCNDYPVATASAWYRPEWGKDAGYVHMVGTHKNHLGKGLGYIVSLATLHRMAEEGRKSVVLTTDDFRLPAIKTYLKLGFEPLVYHKNHRERWTDIFESIGRAELKERFNRILSDPLFVHISERPDQDNPEHYRTAHK